MTLQELKDKIEPYLLKLGYSQGYFCEDQILFDLLNENQVNSDIQFIIFEYEDDKSNRVERKVTKQVVQRARRIQFTNEELKIIDMFDLEISKIHFHEHKQKPSDWLEHMKATDAEDKFMILERGLMKLGYDVSHVVHGNYSWTHRELPQRIVQLVDVISYRGSDNYRSYQKQTLDNHGIMKFTNAELKLLDMLDYKLTSIYEASGPHRQEVTDWLDGE